MNPEVKRTVSDDLVEQLARAQEALRARELSFQLIVDSSPVPVAVTTPTGDVEAVNQPTLEYFGKTVEELRGWKVSDVVHPDDLQHTIATQQTAHETGSAYNVESRHRRADGTYRWFNVRGFPLRDTEGRILRWFHMLIDIDDRKRAEAQLAGEKRLLEMVARGGPLTDVLTALCRFVEDTAADCKCGIYLIDWSGPTFHTGAAPSMPATFNDGLEGLTVEVSAGPCALAALTKSQIIAEDLESDLHWQQSLIRPLALGHGLRAQWSTPICSCDGRVLGTFAVFQDHPASPTQVQQDLIAQVTHIASIAIERASNEEDLKRSEQSFRAIFDEAGTGMALADLQHPDTLIQTNRALQTMLGLSQEKLGFLETYDELTAEADREADAATFRELCEGKRDSLRQEKHFILQDGSSVWANVIFTLLRDSAGLPRFIIAIHEDITERKQAVERLQANRDLLALAQKSARAMAFDWYVQKEVNYWSPDQEALHGLPPGSFDGTYKSWKKTIYPPDWPVLVKAIKHAEETGEVTAEWRIVWPDGSLHWLATTGQMYFDDQGKPFRMVGFTADVTRRKTIEEELRRSAAFLAQAQQLSRTGSFSWRVATDEITWSDELYRIYEFSLGKTITLDVIRTRVHPEDFTLYEKMVEQARNGTDDFEWQYRLLMPDQSIKYMHAVAQATRDPSGQLEYIAAVRDVTARRLADEALDKARSELAHVARVMSLGALTASIAHEVNQPLSGIITNASTCTRMLDAEPPNIDGARETAQRTIRDGRRAADVITRLRALFSKRDTVTELVDLNEATREVIALSQSELERNRVITQIELADQLPPVTGDRVQLQQVILNLVRNASDAMSTVNDRPRQLLIMTEPYEGDQVRLSVQDAGVGFDTQAMKRLFEAFYTTKDDGMGIGLSVSRSIIESHHGRLWAIPNDGPGATFSFSIPRRTTNQY
jgi:PAS domain S-box-containing protein